MAHCLALMMRQGLCLGQVFAARACLRRHTGSGSPTSTNMWSLHTVHIATAWSECRLVEALQSLCLPLELVPLPLQAHRKAALGRVWLTACWLQRCTVVACCVRWHSCLCWHRECWVPEGSRLAQQKVKAGEGWQRGSQCSREGCLTTGMPWGWSVQLQAGTPLMQCEEGPCLLLTQAPLLLQGCIEVQLASQAGLGGNAETAASLTHKAIGFVD